MQNLKIDFNHNFITIYYNIVDEKEKTVKKKEIK